MEIKLDSNEAERFFKSFPESALNVAELLKKSGYEAYFVGGCVRDFLMHRTPNDFDLTTDASSEEIIGVLSENGRRAYLKGGACGTVGVKSPQGKCDAGCCDCDLDCGGAGGTEDEIEITPYRAEYGYYDHRHPTQVVFVKSLNEDLARRDFTVNSFALTLTNELGDGYDYCCGTEIILVDLFGGTEDIEKKLLRCVGNPSDRFDEDALRILRALRFSAQLSFEIEEQTALALNEKRNLLGYISAERKSSELKKMLGFDGLERILCGFPKVFEEIFGSFSPNGTDKICGHFCEKLFYLLRFRNFDDFSNTLDGLKLSCAEKSVILKYKKIFDAFPLSFDAKTDIPIEAFSKLTAENGYFFADYLKIFGRYNEFAYIFENSAVPKISAELDINGAELAAVGFSGNKIGKAILFLLESVLNGKTANRKSELLEYAATAKENEII